MESIQPVLKELKLIKKEVRALRRSLADEDCYLTPAEQKLLREAMDDVAKGKFKTAEQILRELEA